MEAEDGGQPNLYGLCHFGAFSEGGCETWSALAVGGALGWHQVLLFPKQESAA